MTDQVVAPRPDPPGRRPSHARQSAATGRAAGHRPGRQPPGRGCCAGPAAARLAAAADGRAGRAASLLLFHYLPTARQHHRVPGLQPVGRRQPVEAFLHSEWIGFGNFQALFAVPAFWDALVQHAVASSPFQLVFFFPLPIALAILLNSVAVATGCARFVQGVVYLPHFFSWVLVVTFFVQMLGGAGLLANELRAGRPRAVEHHDQPGHVHRAGHRRDGLEGRRLGHDRVPGRTGRHRPEPVRGGRGGRRRAVAAALARHPARAAAGDRAAADPAAR